MRGLHFSLIQLIICVVLILVVAYFLSIILQPQPTQVDQAQQPVPSVPFQNIQMK